MNVLEFTLLVWLGGLRGRLPRRADRPGRRRGHRAAAGPRLRRRPPLRHRRLARLGHRHLLRRRGRLRQGRLLQHPRRHVPGDRHHRSAPWPGRSSAAVVAADAIAVVFGVVLLVSAYLSSRPRRRATGRRHARPAGRAPAARRHLSHAGGPAALPRPARAARLRADVRGRRAVGAARHRLGGASRCWRWTRPCACRSRCPRRRATS